MDEMDGLERKNLLPNHYICKVELKKLLTSVLFLKLNATFALSQFHLRRTYKGSV